VKVVASFLRFSFAVAVAVAATADVAATSTATMNNKRKKDPFSGTEFMFPFRHSVISPRCQ